MPARNLRDQASGFIESPSVADERVEGVPAVFAGANAPDAAEGEASGGEVGLTAEEPNAGRVDLELPFTERFEIAAVGGAAAEVGVGDVVGGTSRVEVLGLHAGGEVEGSDAASAVDAGVTLGTGGAVGWFGAFTFSAGCGDGDDDAAGESCTVSCADGTSRFVAVVFSPTIHGFEGSSWRFSRYNTSSSLRASHS